MTLEKIKQIEENKVSELIKNCSMFFAFSDEQFTKNKTPLQPGEKYVSAGAGAYLPKGQVDNYLNGMKAIRDWRKSIIKDNKLRKENILYELNNHEAFYTGEIEDTLDALGDNYTAKEVWEVYHQNRKKYQ